MMSMYMYIHVVPHDVNVHDVNVHVVPHDVNVHVHVAVGRLTQLMIVGCGSKSHYSTSCWTDGFPLYTLSSIQLELN